MAKWQPKLSGVLSIHLLTSKNIPRSATLSINFTFLNCYRFVVSVN